jgi:hypothetical protein
MNRREFFARFNPFRADLDQSPAPGTKSPSGRNELFRLAMARGIDPATVDPERLPELLGLKAGGNPNTGR